MHSFGQTSHLHLNTATWIDLRSLYSCMNFINRNPGHNRAFLKGKLCPPTNQSLLFSIILSSSCRFLVSSHLFRHLHMGISRLIVRFDDLQPTHGLTSPDPIAKVHAVQNVQGPTAPGVGWPHNSSNRSSSAVNSQLSSDGYCNFRPFNLGTMLIQFDLEAFFWPLGGEILKVGQDF